MAPLSHCQDVIGESPDEPDEQKNGIVKLVRPENQSHLAEEYGDLYVINNLTSTKDDPKLATQEVFNKLFIRLESMKDMGFAQGTLKDVVSVNLTVPSMSCYPVVNAEYVTWFGVNPPVRVCVEGPIDATLTMSVVVGVPGPRQTMHVQGISHWAPANIGELRSQ